MSDILITEFYGDATNPFASVLAWHGGDDPVSASLLLTFFLTDLEDEIKSRRMGAEELASRFLVSQANYDSKNTSRALDAVLITPAAEYGYQLCRIHGVGENLRAIIVLNSYTTEEEIEAAREIWEMAPYPCEFIQVAEARRNSFPAPA